MELDEGNLMAIQENEIRLNSCDRYFWVSCSEFWWAFDGFGDLKVKLSRSQDQEKS